MDDKKYSGKELTDKVDVALGRILIVLIWGAVVGAMFFF